MPVHVSHPDGESLGADARRWSLTLPPKWCQPGWVAAFVAVGGATVFPLQGGAVQ